MSKCVCVCECVCDCVCVSNCVCLIVSDRETLRLRRAKLDCGATEKREKRASIS